MCSTSISSTRCLKLGLRMPRMGWGCKDVHLKAFLEKQSPARAQVYPLERACNKGTRSSVNFPARAYCKSTGWVKSPLDARSSLRQDSARAPNPPLERTAKQCRDAGCSNSTLERHFTRSSGSAKSGNSRLHLQAQNQVVNNSKPILLGSFSGKLL